MNERIKQILSEMDPYMSACTMMEFLARHRKMIYFNISLTKAHYLEGQAVSNATNPNNKTRRW